ncbi:hypothetical protein [Flavobacterium sp. 5]|uniref:hypothetical protein n=1 Tax=Flavobacterium sp. 5 TaxID=2035199 RepID=UPI000C2BF73A|nr:hypothetical protein [Flavobacterium sp. 5]PKB17174.1 hypothetical protein CLU82_2356 [Flavobacterium sp. 5]
MKILDKNSKAMQSLLKRDYRKSIKSIQDTKTETTRLNEELHLTGQESLLFKMYDLEEEDLFV